MTQWDDIKTLAHLLRQEWHGHPIDREQLRKLASRLQPRHPELNSVLGSIHARLASG